MRFGLVPALAKAARPWARARVIGPPPNLEDDVAFLECQIDDRTELGRGFRMYAYPDAAELEQMAAGCPIEFTIYAHQLPVISAAVQPFADPADSGV